MNRNNIPMSLSSDQLEHAKKELERYFPLTESEYLTNARQQTMISVCISFSRQGKDIRDYWLCEETIFDEQTFRNKRMLVWRRKKRESYRGEPQI